MTKVKIEDNGNASIFCPACNEIHVLNIGRKNPWSFNNDLEKPTFSPSLLVKAGHYVSWKKGMKEEDCFICIESRKDNVKSSCGICHSFIKNGNIQFLNDCTHKLAGKTVPLGDI